jgi:DNA-binding Xre family transcriptional regulator
MAQKQGTRTSAELTSLNSFLDEEGIREEVTLHAVKRVLAMQLEQAMQDRKLSKSAMAAQMDTSRAQLARILDPEEYNISLETLTRAAKAVGRQLRVELA